MIDLNGSLMKYSLFTGSTDIKRICSTALIYWSMLPYKADKCNNNLALLCKLFFWSQHLNYSDVLISFVRLVNLPNARSTKRTKGTSRIWTLVLQNCNLVLYQWATETGWIWRSKGSTWMSNCCLVGTISSRICKS